MSIVHREFSVSDTLPALGFTNGKFCNATILNYYVQAELLSSRTNRTALFAEGTMFE